MEFAYEDLEVEEGVHGILFVSGIATLDADGAVLDAGLSAAVLVDEDGNENDLDIHAGLEDVIDAITEAIRDRHETQGDVDPRPRPWEES